MWIIKQMILTLVLSGLAIAVKADPTLKELFPAKELDPPIRKMEKVFYPKDNNANFTYWGGLKDFRVENGVLKFTLNGPRGILGWGNYQGKQPVQDIVGLWAVKNWIELEIKQSCEKSDWRLRIFVDGKVLKGTRKSKGRPISTSLNGKKWQILRYRPNWSQIPTPDGLEFIIKGKKGDKFEIKWLKSIRPTYEGYCRKEFIIPENAKIWRAGANVADWPEGVFYYDCPRIVKLFINGKEVKRQRKNQAYHCSGVDIASYLKPGKNCVGYKFFGVPWIGPVLYFQGTIVLDSGEVLSWKTNDTWKYSPVLQKGWNLPDFDDLSWKSMKTKKKLNSYVIRRSYFDGTVNLPEYWGRMKLKNPGKKDLIYSDDKQAIFEILIPDGYKNKTPIIGYEIGRVDHQGMSAFFRRGTLTNFEIKSDSLLFTLDAKKMAGGVYTVTLILKSDGKVIEERPREPFIVIRKLKQKQVAGTDFLQGLDLELEDEIDYIKADKKRPWFETKVTGYRQPAKEIITPRIVTKNGMTYREGALGRGSNISFRLAPFKYPGDFYLIEVDYPDNAQRDFNAVIASKVKGAGTNCQTGAGVATGGKYYLTGKMKTLRFFHVADAGIHSIDIVNCEYHDTRAAVSAVRIYHVKGDLPAVEIGNKRIFGTFCERCYYTSGHGMNFGINRPLSQEQLKKNEKEMTMHQRYIKDLVWSRETADRYTQYLKFAGQNIHVIGSHQYTRTNTGLVYPSWTGTSRVPHCFKQVLANTLSINDIAFYAGVEFFKTPDIPTFENNAQVAKGADSVWRINGEGKQAYVFSDRTTVNWLHPRVREKFKILMSDLVSAYDMPNFKGLQLFLGFPDLFNEYKGATPYDDNKYIYDDNSFAKFAADTGTKCPGERNDPNRFAEREKFFKDNPEIFKSYREWRCREAVKLLAEARDILKKRDPKGEVMCVLLGPIRPALKVWRKTGLPIREFLQRFSIDPICIKNEKGFWLFRWTTSWTNYGGNVAHRDPYSWITGRDNEIIETFNSAENRGVFIAVSQDENPTASPGHVTKGCAGGKLVKDDWILDTYKIRANPQPSGDAAKEAFVDALIDTDANAIVFGFTDINLPVGHEQALREFAEVFSRLPKEKFEKVLNTDRKTNLVIRQLRKEKDNYFYLVNPGFWPIEGELKIKTSGKIKELINGKKIAVNNGSLPVSLRPYGVLAYQVESPELVIESYKTFPVKEEFVNYIKNYTDKTAELFKQKEYKKELGTGDDKLIAETLQKTAAALKSGQYALAWSLVNGWQFRLASGKMELLNARREKGRYLDRGWQVSKRVEKNGKLKDASCVKLSDALNWQPIESDVPGSGRINVHPIFGSHDGIVYLGNTIEVKEKKPLIVEFGHDGGAKLFVDGKELVCTPNYYPSISYLRDKIPVELEKGKHEFMIVMDLHGGKGWGTKIRFAAPEGKKLQLLDFPCEKIKK